MSIHEWSGDCQSNSGVRGYTDIVGGGVGWGGVGWGGGGVSIHGWFRVTLDCRHNWT